MTPCEKTQLAIIADELDAQAQEHLADCSVCKQYQSQYLIVQQAVQTQRASIPPAVHARVAQSVHQQARKSYIRFYQRCALIAAVLCVAVLWSLMNWQSGPNPSTLQLVQKNDPVPFNWQQLESLEGRVKKVHSSMSAVSSAQNYNVRRQLRRVFKSHKTGIKPFQL